MNLARALYIIHPTACVPLSRDQTGAIQHTRASCKKKKLNADSLPTTGRALCTVLKYRGGFTGTGLQYYILGEI